MTNLYLSYLKHLQKLWNVKCNLVFEKLSLRRSVAVYLVLNGNLLSKVQRRFSVNLNFKRASYEYTRREGLKSKRER
jgi:hypothetical protein